MSPNRIIAPVGSEVVVMAGLCGDDGNFIINQPLEWMLSGDSVGRFIEVGGTDHEFFNEAIKPTARKIDGEYAWGRTSLKPRLITRGNNTPTDDLQVLKGQAWVSVASESGGTSYITVVAPKTRAWDRRRGSTIIHWVDATWAIPAPSIATAGQTAPLNVAVTRTTDGSGIEDWKIRYQIVGGAPAEFLPDGSQQITVRTDDRGQAPVQLRQTPGQVAAGQTQVRVDIIRPRVAGERELVVESGLTSINWSAPALTIRAIGPREAAVDEPFTYRLEILNPGDQTARGVVVRTRELSEGVDFISSNPKPSQFGNQFQWEIGDVIAGGPGRAIDVQFKSDQQGTANLCFEVESTADGLKTEACAQTQIAGPCLGLALDGPASGRVGEQLTFNIQLTNQCNVPLEDVAVQLTHSPGFNSFGGSTVLRKSLDAPLNFGQTATVPVFLQATQAGIQCFEVQVTARGGHSARGRKCVEVTAADQPATGDNSSASPLGVRIENSPTTSLGQNFQTRTTITNNGSNPLTNINVFNRYSASLELKRITDGFANQFGNDDVFIVSVGDLAPGQSVSYVMQFQPLQVDGNAFVQNQALSAENVTGQQRTSVRIEPQTGGSVIDIPQDPNRGIGTPPNLANNPGNLRIQIRPLTPTIRVNETASFQVTVTNATTAPDEDLGITLLIPPGLQFAKADPLNVVDTNPNEVYLEKVRALRAGESITFQVDVRGQEIGRPSLEVRAESRNSAEVSATAAVDINN